LLAFAPGQYLTLVLNVDGQPVRRNYSLSDAPGKPWYRISVKREGEGLVSNWLHDRVEVGAELQVQAPCGEFVLKDADRPLLLVTGGVGITPAMSMLETAAPTGREIHFIHAAKHGGVHAFRDRVQALAEQHDNVQLFYVYDEARDGDEPHATGRVTRDILEQRIPADRDVDLYFLGPKPFMQSIYAESLALGIPAQRLHYEFFGPREELLAA
jgi:nitric oxide dioxygenase